MGVPEVGAKISGKKLRRKGIFVLKQNIFTPSYLFIEKGKSNFRVEKGNR